jgi:hypothetical protein
MPVFQNALSPDRGGCGLFRAQLVGAVADPTEPSFASCRRAGHRTGLPGDPLLPTCRFGTERRSASVSVERSTRPKFWNKKSSTGEDEK